MAVAAEAWTSLGEVRAGVEVGGVPVGGKTREEARASLAQRAVAMERLTLEGESRVLAEADLDVRLDVEATVERAYAVGRTGGPLERVAGRSAALVGRSVDPVIAYDRGAARTALEVLAQDLDGRPRDASIAVEGGEVRVGEAHSGYRLDVAASSERLDGAIRNLDDTATISGRALEPEISTAEVERAADMARVAVGDDLLLSFEGRRWRLAPERVGDAIRFYEHKGELRAELDRAAMSEHLSEVRGTVDIEPVEASYRLSGSGVSVTPSKTGRLLEEEKLLDAIEDGIFEGRSQYEVSSVVAEPDLETAEAARLKPTTVLGEFRTDYTWDTDPGRRANMELASSALSGTPVAPGDVFSYNAVTETLDYEDAKVIEEGAVAYAEGGGLSQVSSTLYMAANYAGLDIVEAHPHSAELPYIPPGLDTTVWFGALDLRFLNNTEGYVLIEQWQGADGYNHARIWGRPTGKEVEVLSRKVHESTDSKGKTTTRYAVSKEITRGDEVLFDDVFRRVTYKELDPYDPGDDR